MTVLPTPPPPDSDVLSNKVLATYFTAREHEVYFRSLKSESDRRNFYPQLVGALTELLAFFDDAASLELLDAFIFRSGKELEPIDQGLQILDYLGKTNARGVELLGLNPPVTFDSLRAAYKNAAKKHHPDLGGSTEDMKLVNLAFAEFHDVISRWKEAPAMQNGTNAPLVSTVGYLGFEVISATEYLISLGIILVSIHNDSWAIDNAYAMLHSLREHGLLATSFAQQNRFAGYFSRLLYRLAERLHTAGLVNEAKSVLDWGQPFKGGAREGNHFPALDEAEAILAGDLELKVVITHPHHADNLYRLKVIDERRYREAQARFQKRHAQNGSTGVDLARFWEQDGFVPLSYDVPFRWENGTKALVPVPGYYLGRINHLSDEQRAVYFRAFGPSGTRDEMKQYLYTRVSSYLCSLIHTFSGAEAEKIERECEFLRKLFPESVDWFDVALEVSRYIRKIDPASRKEKLTLLQKLDTSEKPTFEIRAIETHIRIAPTQNYLSVVMAPPDRLRTKLQTGSTQTPDEVREEKERKEAELEKKEQWRHDWDLIHDLNMSSITARARGCSRDEPEKLVDARKAKIEQLLEAGKRIAPQNTGELQIGYWVDGLSAALEKLKRWEEARYWLELFFSLDAHYQDRLAESTKDKMLKCLANCKSQSAK